MSTDPTFFYDEFFADESDPGIPVEVHAHGKTLTIHLKRTLSLEDSQKAFNKAARFKLNKQTGQKELADYDEQEAIIQTLAQSIKSWPFQYRDGKPVPINAQTVRRLDATVIGQLKTELDRLYAGRKAALDPFVPNSAEAS